MSDPFKLKSPCVDCPFRNDKQPFITAARAKEISLDVFSQDTHFLCHKTVEHDEDGEHCANPGSALHCAGHLIMGHALGIYSQMARIGMRIGLYNPDKLNMNSPSFKNPNDMIKHHKTARKRTSKAVDTNTESP